MKKQKKALVLLVLLAMNFYGMTAVPVSKIDPPKKTEIVNENQLSKEDQLKIDELKMISSMSAEKYGELRGKKLNFVERLAYKATQKRANHLLKKYIDEGTRDVLRKITSFCEGLLFGLLAVLLGYIFLRGDDKKYIKWIWYGFAAWIVILLVLVL